MLLTSCTDLVLRSSNDIVFSVFALIALIEFIIKVLDHPREYFEPKEKRC